MMRLGFLGTDEKTRNTTTFGIAGASHAFKLISAAMELVALWDNCPVPSTFMYYELLRSEFTFFLNVCSALSADRCGV